MLIRRLSDVTVELDKSTVTRARPRLAEACVSLTPAARAQNEDEDAAPEIIAALEEWIDALVETELAAYGRRLADAATEQLCTLDLPVPIITSI